VAVADWDLSPSDFWDMTVQEWWWVYDRKIHQEKSVKDEDGISDLDRERAREIHRAKMNDRT
jgi:hypothetical protein